MAKLVVLLLLLLLCFLLIPHPSYGAGQLEANRKVLSGIAVINERGAGKYQEKQKLGNELRETPMGPDPMHHYGAPPRKPEISP